MADHLMGTPKHWMDSAKPKTQYVKTWDCRVRYGTLCQVFDAIKKA